MLPPLTVNRGSLGIKINCVLCVIGVRIRTKKTDAETPACFN